MPDEEEGFAPPENENVATEDQHYDTVEEWREAGSPVGTETVSVTIGGGGGEPSAPTEVVATDDGGEPISPEQVSTPAPAPQTEPERIREIREKQRERLESRTEEVGTKTDNPEQVSAMSSEKIKRESPELYSILKNEGIEAYNNTVAAQQFVAQQERKRQGTVKGETVKIIAPETVNSQVQDFQNKVEQTLRDNPNLSHHEAVMATLEKEVAGHNQAYKQARINDLKSLGIDVTSAFFPPARALYPDVTIKDIRAIEWVEGGAQIALLALPLIGSGGKAVAASRAAIPAEKILGIARTERAIQPALAGMSVKATKAALSVKEAQFVSEAGKAAQYTTIAAAGGVFTYDTITRWKDMNSTERVMSVAIDTLILSPLVGKAATFAAKPLKNLWNKIAEIHDTKPLDQFLSKVEHERLIQEQAVDDLRTGKVWDDITKAIETNNKPLLSASGQSLQEAGRILELKEAPAARQLVSKGKYLEENAAKLIKSAREAGKAPVRDIKDIREGLDANKQFIDNAEKALKRVKKASTREQIERALKEAKRQVAVATKTKPAPLQRAEELKGKYIPETLKGKEITLKEKEIIRQKGRAAPRESAFPGITTKPTGATGQREETATIPREVWGRMTVDQVARRYGVSEDAALKAFSKLSVDEKGQIFQKLENSTKLSQSEKEVEATKLAPFIKPSISPGSEISPASSTEVKTELKPSTKSKAKTEIKTELKSKTELTKPKSKLEPEPKPRLKPTSTDKEKRERIIQAGGAIAWPQGELHGLKVWHTIMQPYRPHDHVVVTGAAPQGAKLFPGPREAYKSVTLLSGRGPTRPSKFEGGAVDPVVSTVDGKVKITFIKDTSARKRYSKKFSKHRKAITRPSELAPDIVETRRGGITRRHIRV